MPRQLHIVEQGGETGLESPPAAPRNLPYTPTPLIGREEQIKLVLEALSGDEVRLLTLTGPPGIGKTRLAIAVANRAAGLFPLGVCYVPLATVSSPLLVLPAIAQALGLEVAGGRTVQETLGQFLGDKPVLLVLDNFEHLIGAGPEIAELMSSNPTLKALVTSRVRLHIYMEHELPLPPLALPALTNNHDLAEMMRAEAVQLFVGRAMAANRLFRVTEAGRQAIAELCVYLDGIPLALELAAARTPSLTPQAMLSKLKEPGQRLRMLTGGARDLPARQQTLRQAIDWSYDLLTEPERQLFRRLGVFHAGCTLEAVEALCGHGLLTDNRDGDAETGSVPLLDLLAHLVGSSLLQSQETPGGESRFGMLETIREYALDRLRESAEASEMYERHALYYTGLAEQVEAGLAKGTQQLADWTRLEELEVEIGNLRAALAWSTLEEPPATATERTGIGLRLAGALWLFWENRNHASEGREWCELLLGRSAQTWQGTPERVKALFVLGRLEAHQGEDDAARRRYEESLCAWREMGDTWGASLACIGLGQCAQNAGDFLAAEAFFEESLRLRRALGHDWGVSAALLSLALVAHDRGDAPGALNLLEQALVYARRSGHSRSLVHCLNEQARIWCEQGDSLRTLEALRESISVCLKMNDKQSIATGVLIASRVAIAGGHVSSAATLLGVASFLYELKGSGLAHHIDGQLISQVRAATGDARFEALWEEGRRLPLEGLDPILQSMAGHSGKQPASNIGGHTRMQPASPLPSARTTSGSAAWTDLTPRELEVLRLLTQGLRNAEIARQLVISPNTVSMHVRSIFQKLGLNSRSAATSYAFTHNLV